MPRVLAVLPALRPGGAEMQLTHLLLALPRETFTCELVTLFSVESAGELGARLRAGDVVWRDLAVSPSADRPMGAGHAARNLWRSRRALAAQIGAFRPDVVYSRLWYAGVAVGSLDRRRLGFAHVANEENTLDSLDDSGRVKRQLRRWVVGQADRWVAPTRGLYDQLVRAGAAADRGRVIHNSTPLPELTSCSPAVPGGPLRVAAMGRLVPAKGFGRLLEVARRLRASGTPFTLEVAGEGPERAALEERARALGVADVVRFVGHVADPHAFLRERDVFVLTSHTEGFANVLAEAMACGRPTLAFDIDFGPSELIRHGETGYLVPDGDLEAFAAHLRTLAGQPELRATLGRAGRERAEREFSVPRMAARFGELFSEAARLGRGREVGDHVRHSW